jgi:hypothetical protein
LGKINLDEDEVDDEEEEHEEDGAGEVDQE